MLFALHPLLQLLFNILLTDLIIDLPHILVCLLIVPGELKLHLTLLVPELGCIQLFVLQFL